MMLKKFRCLALVMVLVLVIVSSTTFAEKKPIRLVYGHTWSADHYYMKGDLYFKRLVEKNSKGQILVDIFPGAQLGGPQEMLQATRNGAQQMTACGLGGFISGLWPKLATFELPWLIKDYPHMLKIIDKFNSWIDPDELVAKTGVRVIGFKTGAPRQLTTKFPVNKLEDIKGLKVRVPQTPSWVAMWKALGAAPTIMPLADVYTALATGTADAQENPFSSIYSYKFFEQQKYCALTAHQLGFYIMIINNNFWNSLTVAQRKIIQDAADKCTKMTNKATLADDKECYQLLSKAGMKFTKPDRTPFREKGKTIWKQFGDRELIKKIEAINE
jgi:tripartite ATP-independent transporter DctP family solute receptor